MNETFSTEWNSDRKLAWLLDELRLRFQQVALEVRLPMLGPNLTKGGVVAKCGRQSYALPQCHTLLVTAATCRNGNSFCIQRAFRANDVNSRFHLQEFDLLECGLLHTSSEQAMTIIESMLADIRSAMGGKRLQPFSRIAWAQMNTSAQSFQIFDEESPGREELQDFSHGVNLSEPIFLTNLPWTQSSWATATVSPSITTRFNLLVPEIGEIVEGGERLLDQKSLTILFDRIGILSQMGWYADSLSAEVGPVTVFAIGIERLAMWLFGYDDIRESHTWTMHPGVF